ncbi:restriction endonuclease subunit S [Bacillus altitudinis]|uniref:restriction endonuclease subunit S n=1 Tax=Bacillus altitudinis TaxID=293387 RepID=UPI00272D7AA2|nr:restriction endonuclease subunit S [Bacillus altitudinis]WLF32219.1 restriction endonuclease subunit S [Bacillus altitudinis]
MKQGYLEYKESGYEWLGEIPLHWELKKAKWSFKEKSIKGYPDELLLSVSKGKGVIPRGELENKTVMAFKDLQNFKLVLPEDFVIHLRSFQSGFEMSMNKGIVSPAYTVFSCKNGLLPSYYKFLFYMQNFIDAIASTTQSLRDGKPIAYRDFSNMVLPFPKYNEQVKIANFLKVKLKEVDNLIYTKKKLILLLEQQRQSIITEAVTKGLNPNVKMKDSGVEWIGEIPEHWDTKKIKYLIQEKLLYGANESAELDDEKLPRYIRITDIDELGNLKNETFKSIPLDIANKYVVKKGDILLARSGATVGKSYIHKEEKEASYAGYLIKLRARTLELAEYIYYFTNSSLYKQWINSILIQATIQNVSAEKYANLSIPVPNNENEIKSILLNIKFKEKEILEVINKLKEQIEKLKEYRQSLIYEAVTGKIDVRDMELDEVR